MSSAVPTCLRRPVTLSRTTPRSTCASAGTSMTSQCASREAAWERLAAFRAPTAARQAAPRYGPVQCWSAKLLQVRITTWVPFVAEPLGSVRHRPLSASTYSPLEWCTQVWALWLLQVQITILAPTPPWLESSRHLPWTDSAPLTNVHCWDTV